MFLCTEAFSLLSVLVLSCLIMLVLCYQFIELGGRYFSALARPDTPQEHRAKDFTPTMGGIAMVGSFLLVALCWLDWSVELALFVVLITLFCSIGTWDDLMKIRYKKGISEQAKFVAQMVSAILVVALWHAWAPISTEVVVPFLFQVSIPFVLFLIWAVWVILCTVNAVNFTDGLDGLATLVVLPNITFFTLIALITDNIDIAIIGCSWIGILLGFLWYNAYPAAVFMGDAGSLALGSLLAFMALRLKAECLLPLTGIILVIEGVSVVAQILSFKATGKRLFRLAPIHHHFELCGYAETQITMRFFIITLIACAAAFVLFVS